MTPVTALVASKLQAMQWEVKRLWKCRMSRKALKVANAA
jgi:hypothetical protein